MVKHEAMITCSMGCAIMCWELILCIHTCLRIYNDAKFVRYFHCFYRGSGQYVPMNFNKPTRAKGE